MGRAEQPPYQVCTSPSMLPPRAHTHARTRAHARAHGLALNLKHQAPPGIPADRSVQGYSGWVGV